MLTMEQLSSEVLVRTIASTTHPTITTWIWTSEHDFLVVAAAAGA